MTHITRKLRFLLFISLILAAFVVALPASAAPGGTIISTSVAGCNFDVTVQVEDAGFYAVNMWDDGNFRAGAGATVPAGGTFTVRFTIGGVILQGASGIGIYLENAVGLAATSGFDTDTQDYWSDLVGTDCAALGTWGAVAILPVDACLYPLPSGTPIYSVPAGALAFYAADPGTYTGFNLPPGTWYITEFGAAYAKVWIACDAQPIYIPVENVVR